MPGNGHRHVWYLTPVDALIYVESVRGKIAKVLVPHSTRDCRERGRPPNVAPPAKGPPISAPACHISIRRVTE